VFPVLGQSESLRKLARNPIFCGLAIFATLALVSLLWYAGWRVLFTILISWVLADAIIGVIFRGGRGIFQIRLLGTSTQPKGYAYLAFAAAIIFTTLISNSVAKIMADLTTNIAALIAASFFATLLVWSDLQLRFYRESS